MYILLLRKSLFSDRYTSIEGMFEGEQTLFNIMSTFPTAYLFIVNECKEFHNNRIIDKNRAKEIFNIDNKNQIRCENCMTKNLLSKKFCRNCGYENKDWHVLKYYDENIMKAVDLKEIIYNEIWTGNAR